VPAPLSAIKTSPLSTFDDKPSPYGDNPFGGPDGYLVTPRTPEVARRRAWSRFHSGHLRFSQVRDRIPATYGASSRLATTPSCPSSEQTRSSVSPSPGFQPLVTQADPTRGSSSSLRFGSTSGRPVNMKSKDLYFRTFLVFAAKCPSNALETNPDHAGVCARYRDLPKSHGERRTQGSFLHAQYMLGLVSCQPLTSQSKLRTGLSLARPRSRHRY
jgi:hypothetical protein